MNPKRHAARMVKVQNILNRMDRKTKKKFYRWRINIPVAYAKALDLKPRQDIHMEIVDNGLLIWPLGAPRPHWEPPKTG